MKYCGGHLFFICLVKCNIKLDLFTDTAAILNSEEIMGCPGGR